jgi:dipeptidyl aminopeptidase/acylaminoacyl peptidase
MKLSRISKCLTLPSSVIGNAKVIILVVIVAGLGGWFFMQNTNNENEIMPENLEGITTAAYGAWESPVTAASIFEASDNISTLVVENNELYFIERRASANGRNILVKLDDNNEAVQLTPSEISVRTRVHEYGGRPYLVDGSDIYYSQFTDQKVYKVSTDSEAQALTTDGLRFMHCVMNHSHNQLICVREDHRGLGEAVNTLVAIDLSDNENESAGEILFEGTDFVSSPQISPDGKSLAFITWSHPNMPWDDTQLRVITFSENGSIESQVEVPQEGNVSIANPQYSADNTLYFTADFANWATLYRLNEDGQVELVLDQDIEIGSYGFENETSAAITYSKDGLRYLARVDLSTGAMTNIGEAFSNAGSIAVADNGVYFIASTPSSLNSIYLLNGDSYSEVYKPSGPQISAEYLSIPQAFTFPTGASEEAYGFYYPPVNENFQGPEDSLPPLIVKVHGGPVGATSSTLDPRIQFWTSRGFALFDVNHRGSTGYGREFRKKLYPAWGIVDIEDAANGVNWLAEQGLIDADKVAIRGGSAGGYTTLAAMAFQDVFKAGASYYGISDLEVLNQDTHKYESRYLDQLIGVYPERRDVYLQRSPINSVNNIQAPLLLLQGLEDKVVPPNQSELIFEALKANCIPTAYIAFEGEGHGFRQPANNIKALNSELDFYGQIFGFTPAGNIEPVTLERCSSIEN